MKPLPHSHQELPSTDHLCESPQLAILAVLQSALRVTGQVLDIQHPELDCPAYLQDDSVTDDLLAQLIVDRCRELSELVTYYRRVLHPEEKVWLAQTANDFPF
jgi:hypothetical protein